MTNAVCHSCGTDYPLTVAWWLQGAIYRVQAGIPQRCRKCHYRRGRMADRASTVPARRLADPLRVESGPDYRTRFRIALAEAHAACRREHGDTFDPERVAYSHAVLTVGPLPGSPDGGEAVRGDLLRAAIASGWQVP